MLGGAFAGGSVLGAGAILLSAGVASAVVVISEPTARGGQGRLRRLGAVVAAIVAGLLALGTWAFSAVAFSGCWWSCDPEGGSLLWGATLTIVTGALLGAAGGLFAWAARAQPRTARIVIRVAAGLGIAACLAMAIAA